MALTTAPAGTFYFGAVTVTVTVTYDTGTFAIARLNVVNGGALDCVLKAVHPTTGNPVTYTVPAGSSRNINVPTNTYFWSSDPATAVQLTIYPQGM